MADASTNFKRGDAMQNLKVLFIAGFGPIVHESGESRKLYRDVLGIAFKEESDGYLHTEAVPGAKTFALWPLSQVAQSCFGKDRGPRTFQPRRHGLNSMWRVLKRPPPLSNLAGIECLSKTRKNRGGKSLAVSSPQKGYWLASHSLQ
jgi:hypothetical protein